jgi:hypothetical protein
MQYGVTPSIAITTLTTLSLAAATMAQASNQIIGSPTPSTGPTLAQLGSVQAYVPMKHDNCDGVVDCKIHKLATTSGNLNMKARIGMSCSAGQTVTSLAYQPEGQNIRRLINGNTNSQSRVLDVTMQPFSRDEFEKAGQAAFGGSWPIPGRSNNTTKIVKKTLKKSISVLGRCSGSAITQMKSFPVTVTTTFEDKDFPTSPPR